MGNLAVHRRNISALTERGVTCVDMHLHTCVSKDAFTPVSRCLERARELGIGLAITDHNEIRGAFEAWERRGSTLIIPGIEVKAQDGVDILVYFREPQGLEEYYKSVVEPAKKHNPFQITLPVQRIIEEGARRGAVISAPHPFAPKLLGLGAVIGAGSVAEATLSQVPLIETMNATMSIERNAAAAAWASEKRKFLTGGSDAHVPRHIGNVLTCMELRDGEHFLDAICTREAAILGVRTPSLLVGIVFVAGQLKLLFQPGGIRMFMDCFRTYLDLSSRIGQGRSLPFSFPS